MILLAAALLTLSASQAAYAQLPGQVGKENELLGPDLITDGIREMSLYKGKLEIAVRNIGKKPSKQSLVRIEVTMSDGTGPFARSKDVRALAPGQVVWVPVSFTKQLSLAKYCVVADALKQNQETDEKNNERCGEFSGKP